MSDPTPTASGDLEAVAAFLKERDENVAPGEADDAERLESARYILAAIRPANPPATAAGVGEAVDWKWQCQWLVRNARDKTLDPDERLSIVAGFPIDNPPASHDALIARVEYEVWQHGRWHYTRDTLAEAQACVSGFHREETGLEIIKVTRTKA